MIRLERSGEIRILATLVEISQALALARDVILEVTTRAPLSQASTNLRMPVRTQSRPGSLMKQRRKHIEAFGKEVSLTEPYGSLRRVHLRPEALCRVRNPLRGESNSPTPTTTRTEFILNDYLMLNGMNCVVNDS
jgi:hypothetical protein